MSIFNAFRRHPASVGESYIQHQRSAFGFGLRMMLGGLACLVHGLFPFLCMKTGSRQISLLHDRMVRNRHGDRRHIPHD